MNAAVPPPLPVEKIPRVDKTLRRLFLTLFLRGRSSRGLNKQTAPKSIGQRLAFTLGIYALFGCMALAFARQPVFGLAVYLHAMTVVFLGMFVAASAGEILFNKEEADILLHRPISPKVLLWSKVRVLVEVSLWLAGAFNAVGLIIGTATSGAIFPIAHIIATAMEALFCTGCVVLVYQLCLRWFGRERLDSLMTAAQVLVAIAAVLSGQILPRLVMTSGHVIDVKDAQWWLYVLPPAWFAGFDDAIAGSHSTNAWLLGVAGIVATLVVLWLAFGKLARDYESGLQAMNQTTRVMRPKGTRRFGLDRLVNLPPLRWGLRDPVTRASFLLTAAYLIRDRDVKLRVYPGLAPILIIPFVFLFQSMNRGAKDASFGVPLSGLYAGMVPLLALQLLRFSQQWQAADIFRVAPLEGPRDLSHGATRAVIYLLAIPMLLVVALIVWLMSKNTSHLLLLLPGIIALPVFAMIPSVRGHGVPLSQPPDEAKSAGRGLYMIGVMMASFALSGLAAWSWSKNWFWWFVGAELIVTLTLWFLFRRAIARSRWEPLE